MSRYCFIASDDDSLPEVDLHKPNASGRIIFDSEAELGDLFIKKVNIDEAYRDVEYYTDLPVIYDLDFCIDEQRVGALIDFLKANTKRKKRYALYQIWLANARNQASYKAGIKEGLDNLHKTAINTNELKTNNLISLFNEYTWLRIKLYR